jgi:uncharacterized damage-inducible protein DinB
VALPDSRHPAYDGDVTVRWFDRTFDPGLPPGDAPALLARLGAAPDRLEAAVRGLPADLLTHRPGGRWSMQEHAGHLGDLEDLWRRRLDDFAAGAALLHPADLTNRKTDEARHNDAAIGGLLTAFRAARLETVRRAGQMSEADLGRTSLHPRLQQPMTPVDLCFFVAEHDDHHLSAIARIRDGLTSLPPYALELLLTVDRAAPRLAALEDDAAARRPAPGKWSPREIVGHLIDSASNNHQRFVRAVFQQDLMFAGYAQDDWVAVQGYQDAPWGELVALWAGYNRHLARVMARIPADVRERVHVRHCFDRLAFRPVPANEPSTLGYFMDDYVRHLKHHLDQIPGVR